MKQHKVDIEIDYIIFANLIIDTIVIKLTK